MISRSLGCSLTVTFIFVKVLRRYISVHMVTYVILCIVCNMYTRACIESINGGNKFGL